MNFSKIQQNHWKQVKEIYMVMVDYLAVSSKILNKDTENKKIQRLAEKYDSAQRCIFYYILTFTTIFLT